MRYYVFVRLEYPYGWFTLGTWRFLSTARSDAWRQQQANPNRTVRLWDSEERKWIT